MILSGQRPGALMAWSALVRYCRDVQGWDVVREKEHKGFLVTGMARRTEPQHGLPVRLSLLPWWLRTFQVNDRRARSMTISP